jgi:hypothetical protein
MCSLVNSSTKLRIYVSPQLLYSNVNCITTAAQTILLRMYYFRFFHRYFKINLFADALVVNLPSEHCIINIGIFV